MCQSKANGGRRCYGHAVQRLASADRRWAAARQAYQEALAAASGGGSNEQVVAAARNPKVVDARQRMEQAYERRAARMAELASTDKGRELFAARVDEATRSGNPMRVRLYQAALDAGAKIGAQPKAPAGGGQPVAGWDAGLTAMQRRTLAPILDTEPQRAQALARTWALQNEVEARAQAAAVARTRQVLATPVLYTVEGMRALAEAMGCDVQIVRTYGSGEFSANFRSRVRGQWGDYHAVAAYDSWVNRWSSGNNATLTQDEALVHMDQWREHPDHSIHQVAYDAKQRLDAVGEARPPTVLAASDQ